MGSGLGKEEAHHLEVERGQQEQGQSGPACEVGGAKEMGDKGFRREEGFKGKVPPSYQMLLSSGGS